MKPLPALKRAAAELPAGAIVVVACSGGRDSMALMHAATAVDRWRLRVATVDHRMHPESHRHASFVVAEAAARQLPAAVLTGDPAEIARGAGPEAGARAVRLALLEQHAGAVGAQAILTAHTADDQAETVLMRWVDGAGGRGLAGIPPRRGPWVRPWLPVSRQAVADFAAAHGLAWCTDPTNADRRFRRNALRDEVMPALERFADTGWTARATASAAHVRGLVDLAEWFIADRPDLIRIAAGRLVVSVDGLGTMPRPAARAVLALAVSGLLHGSSADGRGFGKHVDAVLELEAGARRSLPGGLEARRRGAQIIVAQPTARPAVPEAARCSPPFVMPWGPWTVRVDGPMPFDPAAGDEAVAASTSPGPWTVRVAAPGERYRPRGSPGRKALRRLWADRGLDRALRPSLPVVESGGRLIAAAGLRAAEHGRVRPGAPAWTVRFEDVDPSPDGGVGRPTRK